MLGLDWTSVGVIGAMSTVLGYFLKKTDRKIDDLAEKVERFEGRIIEKFCQICEERQGACSALREERLNAVKMTQTSFCSKLERLEEQRREDWREQKTWNTRIEDRLTPRGGPGR